MPLQIIHGDITKITCDAIVNAANPTLLGGGGVDGAIHKAAGPRLLFECMKLGGCKVGRAKITKGYRLPSRYIIHTVGPRWKGGKRGEAQQLSSCYSESLKLAKQYGCKTVAFPLISAGIYGYPREQVMQIASETINKCLQDEDMQVYLVIYA
ncbi:MAG: macro domain-containing protein [Lachnospiraceae bacterium]|nr:macro domain-containing protein [Lachnospiraceae bacterium]